MVSEPGVHQYDASSNDDVGVTRLRQVTGFMLTIAEF